MVANERGVLTNQRAVRCTIMRGGTSKGVFFREEDLPQDPQERDRVILAVMGSPDRRQINGLGGADPLSSKIAIIGPGAAYGADVTYTFGQVGVDQAYVAYSGNCGNISSAVGVYAIEEGFVPPREPETVVRIYNTNAKQMLLAYVPVKGGLPVVEGDFAIDGVPGTGAEIRLDFSKTAGATTGKLLPTGNPTDELFVPELGRKVTVSIVDMAKATVFFHAREVGMKGTEGPSEFDQELLQRFWAIRNAAAALIGLSPDSRLPTPVAVSEPQDYVNYATSQVVPAQSVTFVARRVIGPPPVLHKAFATTGGVCAAVASLIPGTVVHAVAVQRGDGVVRIGHPTGVFPIRAVMGEGLEVKEVSLSRTARRLMEGTAYIPWSV